MISKSFFSFIFGNEIHYKLLWTELIEIVHHENYHINTNLVDIIYKNQVSRKMFLASTISLLRLNVVYEESNELESISNISLYMLVMP